MEGDIIKRAIQISALNPYQLERLHELENKTNYLLPNWNIQEIFGLDSVKYTYNVNTDTCQDYCREIEKQIRGIGLEKQVEFEDTWFNYCHAFDWAVMNSRDRIEWKKQGKSGKGNGLWSRLKKEVVDHKVLASEGTANLVEEF